MDCEFRPSKVRVFAAGTLRLITLAVLLALFASSDSQIPLSRFLILFLALALVVEAFTVGWQRRRATITISEGVVTGYPDLGGRRSIAISEIDQSGSDHGGIVSLLTGSDYIRSYGGQVIAVRRTLFDKHEYHRLTESLGVG